MILLQDSRPPPAYFPPCRFVKDPFMKEQSRSERIIFLQQICSFFQLLEFPQFYKNPEFWWKRLLRNNIILYAFYNKFVAFSRFATNQVFLKIILLFSKKNFVRIWETFLFQLHFTANFLYFGDEKLPNSESLNFAKSCNWQVNVEKRTLWVDDFLSVFKYVFDKFSSCRKFLIFPNLKIF